MTGSRPQPPPGDAGVKTLVEGPTRAISDVALLRDGYLHLRDQSPADLVAVLEGLGTPIYIEEVHARATSTALVTSTNAVPWHTDHHRADRIVWYCLQQADQGGETLLVDGHAALALITPEQRDVLNRIKLFEHSVFRNDPTTHPVLTHRDGLPRIYYSFWLGDIALSPVERDALDAFTAALNKVPHHRFLLEPGDILACDNTRMLHARTPIEGTGSRHLRRYWLTVG